MDPVSPEGQQTSTSTTYKMKLLYVTKTKDKETDVVQKLKCLMARLCQYASPIQLLPYDSSSSINPIVSAKDVPSNLSEFHVFAPYAFVNSKTKMLKMNFRISSELPLWRLKLVPGIKSYIEQYGIYLHQTYLFTTDNAKVGGLILSHPQYTKRETAIRDLNIRINENESIKTPIQLAPYTMWNGRESQAISTKVLAVECAKEHVKEVKRRLFTKLLNVPENMELSNTRFFKFLPFTASGAITDKVIRSGIYLQNKYLLQCTAVTIINLKNVDWIVPTTDSTFRSIILSIDLGEEESVGRKMFSTIEMTSVDNKAHLITTKSVLSKASAWFDNFTRTMLEHDASSEFWKNETGYDGPPQRIQRPETSDAHVAYANFLGQTFAPMVGSNDEANAPKSAPPPRSYSRVVYGTKRHSSSAGSTQGTAISTLSSSEPINDSSAVQNAVNIAVNDIQQISDQVKGDLKEALLEDMKALNRSSDERMNRIEESTNNFENMLREMHDNNKKQAKELMHYEERLETITTLTAATSTKVDRLNVAVKSFIQVMADVVGTMSSTGLDKEKKERLVGITTYLDDHVSDDDDMELDEIDTKKRKPPPGTVDALGGGGGKK